MTPNLPPNAVFAPPVKQPINPPPGLPGEPAEAAPVAPKKPAVEMAVLRFLNPEALSKTVALKYPFAFDGEDGEREVHEVIVRRLAVAEVGAIVLGKSFDALDLYDFYAAMTGLPAPVLRAMPDDEGVIDACLPFLPQPVKELLAALDLGNGAASPSPAPKAAASPSETS